ncbi:probable beta-D-xylosidase 6 [Tanacetum coccineum]
MSSTTITVILILITTLTTIKNSQASSLAYPCQPPHHNSYPFCNTTLPIQTRAKSLISHLTLSEKITCLADNNTGIPRLGIPSYQWWSEALHGITANRPGVNFTNGPINTATMFPQVIVTTSSFNRTLWYAIASAIAVEARAMYNVGQAGLTFWAPTINVFRDPRWGRGQETPGEDPRVAGAYAVEFVTAFQGGEVPMRGDGMRSGRKSRVLSEGGEDDELMVSACCKHFSAYDLDNWGNYTRYDFNAIVTEQDMQDTYQLPFRSCIQEAKASCLMCSYNAVNGIPACADKDLLQKARTEWDFKGYITSDCDAVATIYEHHNYTKTPEDAVAIALKAGMDLNCGTYMLRYTQSAIDQRKVVEEDIDKALLNLFTVQFRLGLFNGDPIKGKFGKLGTSDVCSSDHKNLALEAARQGIVLLKNDNKFLPLHKNVVSSLAVIGPMANATSELGGGYSGIPCSPTSILEGLKTYVKETSYSYGCLDVACTSKARFFEAVSISKEADFVIVVAGLDLTQENEEHDRLSLLLPCYQKDLITSIAATSRKPIVLVLTGGGPVDVSFAQGDPRIASIIWVGYPGEAGGTALAEVIFGDHNPEKGLDDCYMQIRSNILSRDTLPDVRSAYAIISSEESHRVVSNHASSSNSGQRPQSSTVQLGNRKTGDGSQLVLCGIVIINGHTIDRCFKIIGYPPDFGKKGGSGNSTTNGNNGQSFNRRFVNNNSVGSSSTSSSTPFSDEQIIKLISMIKENSSNNAKGVHVNMAGFRK